MRHAARIAAVSLLLLAPILSGEAAAQCILANPSFELSGSGGAVFGGWSQFGVVGSTTFAWHGSDAARVTGPDYGGWDVSGFWQELDSAPGEQWEITVHVAHSSSSPLTGQSKAIVNIEWRDSGGNLLSYESHDAAVPSTPADEYQDFRVVTGPAPSGTAGARILLGVLQSPTDPPPVVYYDQVTFFNMASPTIYEDQWGDFPGGRTLQFGGLTWRVKGPGYYGPGPNLFSDSASRVWVDVDGRLHMTITHVANTWYSTEVALVETLGYGDYVFTTRGSIDELDPAVVLGLFLWQYGPCYDSAYLWWNPYNEVDVEFSYWGNASSNLAQFVAQPYDYPGNLSQFDAGFGDDELSSHAFHWQHDRVEFRSWRGGPDDESPGNMIHSWTYTGPHIPRPEIPRVHINLWRCCGTPAVDQEVVFESFTFRPEIPESGVPDSPGDAPSGGAAARLFPARPNPFGPETLIAYTLGTGADVEVTVYSVSGRRVRTLVSGFVPAGEHGARWDGTDDDGNRVASGVYLYELRTGETAEARRMVLMKQAAE